MKAGSGAAPVNVNTQLSAAESEKLPWQGALTHATNGAQLFLLSICFTLDLAKGTGADDLPN